MQWRNTLNGWGWISIALHWSIALAIVGLFVVGLYMVDLGYMDPLYTVLPFWHRNIGLLVGLFLLVRLAWRFYSPPPQPLPNYRRVEHVMATMMHWVLYALLIVMVVSGYLISTADGRGLMFFGWFELPSITGRISNLEDTAGDIHYWIAWTLIGLASMHGLAALKHHFVDRDITLARMLRPMRRATDVSNHDHH